MDALETLDVLEICEVGDKEDILVYDLIRQYDLDDYDAEHGRIYFDGLQPAIDDCEHTVLSELANADVENMIVKCDEDPEVLGLDRV